MTDFKELWNKSGQKYHGYSLAYPQYSETNAKIVELADVKPGQTAVDLACGTGLTAQNILKKLNGTGKVYCLDFAEDMINIAKKNLNNSRNISYIIAPAEDIATVMPEQVDRIICNAGFWQFEDKTSVLAGIKKILKNDGLFVFNLPQQFYEMESDSHRREIIQIIFEELEKRGYPTKNKMVSKFNEISLEKLMNVNGLKIKKIELGWFEGSTLKDSLAFFRIPAVAPFFEGVPEETKDQILGIVEEKLHQKYQTSPNVWAYFIVEKNSNNK